MSMSVRRSWPVHAVSARSSPQRAQDSTASTLTCSRVRVLAHCASLVEGPLPLAPGRAVASSGLCEAGRLELALLFGVCFSMNTAISTLNSISRASNSARLSALILPAAHSDSKRAFRASNSARNDALFTVAMGPTARPRPPSSRRAPRGAQPPAAPRSAGPSSGPCA